MISFLLSNESLCDGPTNGPGGRTPHFYSCFYDLNGMKLLFLWLLTSSQRFLFICFINQETFLSPQQQKGLLWNVFLCWKSAIYQTRNKLENWLQRIIFFPGLRGIEMDRKEIYVFDFPFSNSIQIKFRGKNFAKLHRYMRPPLSVPCWPSPSHPLALNPSYNSVTWWLSPPLRWPPFSSARCHLVSFNVSLPTTSIH